MRFVAVKTREQQSQAMLFRTRDLLVRQRTPINALRGHLREFGVSAPRGPAHVDRLAEAIEDADSGLPGPDRGYFGRTGTPISEEVEHGFRRKWNLDSGKWNADSGSGT